MEKLVKKICVDTDVVISLLKGDKKTHEMIDKLEGYDLCITSVTFFELSLRKYNLDQIEYFASKVQIIEFDEESAREASFLHKELKRTGRLMEVRDIFIAAICISKYYDLATFNKKHFQNIKNLKLLI